MVRQGGAVIADSWLDCLIMGMSMVCNKRLQVSDLVRAIRVYTDQRGAAEVFGFGGASAA